MSYLCSLMADVYTIKVHSRQGFSMKQRMNGQCKKTEKQRPAEECLCLDGIVLDVRPETRGRNQQRRSDLARQHRQYDLGHPTASTRVDAMSMYSHLGDKLSNGFCTDDGELLKQQLADHVQNVDLPPNNPLASAAATREAVRPLLSKHPRLATIIQISGHIPFGLSWSMSTYSIFVNVDDNPQLTAVPRVGAIHIAIASPHFQAFASNVLHTRGRVGTMRILFYMRGKTAFIGWHTDNWKCTHFVRRMQLSSPDEEEGGGGGMLKFRCDRIDPYLSAGRLHDLSTPGPTEAIYHRTAGLASLTSVTGVGGGTTRHLTAEKPNHLMHAASMDGGSVLFVWPEPTAPDHQLAKRAETVQLQYDATGTPLF